MTLMHYQAGYGNKAKDFLSDECTADKIHLDESVEREKSCKARVPPREEGMQ